MKLHTQHNLTLQTEIRKLEKILPAVDNSQKENVDVVRFKCLFFFDDLNFFHFSYDEIQYKGYFQDEILSLTISYIGLLHNQVRDLK